MVTNCDQAISKATETTSSGLGSSQDLSRLALPDGSSVKAAHNVPSLSRIDETLCITYNNSSSRMLDTTKIHKDCQALQR